MTISNIHFQTAIKILNDLTTSNKHQLKTIDFGNEFDGQHILATAFKILNEAALIGTVQQKTQLLSYKNKITRLNHLLKSPDLSAEITRQLGIQMGKDISQISGMQVYIPKKGFRKFVEILTKIPRIIFSIFVDVLSTATVLIPGGIIYLCSRHAINFNPTAHDIRLKKGKTPILLLHGTNFNESQWFYGKHYLKSEQFGPVFSINYDGFVTNEWTKGIDDYARTKISAEAKRIKELTKNDRLTLIGHSMGGLVAGYYAEYVSENDHVKVERVISIGSPWQGVGLIDFLIKIFHCFSNIRPPKRMEQMSLKGGGSYANPKFRQNLIAKARDSERKGFRKYYNIWSTTDGLVPGEQGRLTEDSRRQLKMNYAGHLGLLFLPGVWIKIRSWLMED